MTHFEELIEEKLNHITSLIEPIVEDVKDHETRLRVIEKWKYKLAAAGTAIAGTLGATGHKIGEWLGFGQN